MTRDNTKRRVFVDAGGFNGCSVERFRKDYDPQANFEIFSFEPNPIFEDSYSEFENHTLIKKAVWISDGQMNFYLDRHDSDGSSLLVEKKTGNLDKKTPITVESVDLDSWIKKNFSTDDFIILKIDIEGAEYEVLSKMLKENSIDYLNSIFIEWHWNKIGLSKATHDRLVEQIKARKIPIDDTWDAIPSEYYRT